jgi:hypothetical protein
MVERSGLEEVHKSGARDGGGDCGLQPGEVYNPLQYRGLNKTLAELGY